jgi:hypothetical protein
LSTLKRDDDQNLGFDRRSKKYRAENNNEISGGGESNQRRMREALWRLRTVTEKWITLNNNRFKLSDVCRITFLSSLPHGNRHNS